MQKKAKKFLKMDEEKHTSSLTAKVPMIPALQTASRIIELAYQIFKGSLSEIGAPIDTSINNKLYRLFMLDKDHSVATQESSPMKPHKTLCTKCVKSIPAYQFDFHYEHCGVDDDYVVFHPHEEVEDEYKLDIDFFDVPISGSSVQLKGKVAAYDPFSRKLPLVPYLPGQEKFSRKDDCCFCAKKLQKDEKVAVLPCGHPIHESCILKWTIIVEPCRICHKAPRKH